MAIFRLGSKWRVEVVAWSTPRCDRAGMKFRSFLAADGEELRCDARVTPWLIVIKTEFGVVYGIHHRGTMHRREGHGMSQCVSGRLHPS